MLRVQDLSLEFSTFLGKVQAVRGISFEIGQGEIVALVGESGCGKSATAQTIMGLSQAKVTGGQIYFGEHNLLEKSPKEMERIRGNEISMIFQDPMTSLNPTMRVGTQIMEGLRKHRGLSMANAREKALEILQQVGISEPAKRLQQYPHELSGGMRQRVLIALALACEPQLLIADEPTTALDVTIQAQILELMQQIQKAMGMSILLITHDLGIVAGICDRVLVMYGGEIVESGTVDQIFKAPFHPYTQGLLRSVPRLDMDRSRQLDPIRGHPPNLLTPPKGCGFCARCPHAMNICPEESPPLFQLDNHHKAACWLKVKDEHTVDHAKEPDETVPC